MLRHDCSLVKRKHPYCPHRAHMCWGRCPWGSTQAVCSGSRPLQDQWGQGVPLASLWEATDGAFMTTTGQFYWPLVKISSPSKEQWGNKGLLRWGGLTIKPIGLRTPVPHYISTFIFQKIIIWFLSSICFTYTLPRWCRGFTHPNISQTNSPGLHPRLFFPSCTSLPCLARIQPWVIFSDEHLIKKRNSLILGYWDSGVFITLSNVVSSQGWADPRVKADTECYQIRRERGLRPGLDPGISGSSPWISEDIRSARKSWGWLPRTQWEALSGGAVPSPDIGIWTGKPPFYSMQGSTLGLSTKKMSWRLRWC